MLDILIVGSGPAGLSAAVYAKRAGLDILVLEKMYNGAGQITQSSMVDNYLGFEKISGAALGSRFREHAQKLGVAFYYSEAESYQKTETGWSVQCRDGKRLEAKTVIYAAGAAHRQLNVAGEQELFGKGVSYCATCDGAFFKGKRTVVVGGGNTALDDALYLSDLCDRVFLVHRRAEFRGSKATLAALEEKENVQIVRSAQVEEIIGQETVSGVELTDGRKLLADGVFIAAGMVPQTEKLRGIVALDESGCVIADETGKTDAAGFFAAGDVRAKALKQVATAVSDGANAAFSAGEYLHQQERKQGHDE